MACSHRQLHQHYPRAIFVQNFGAKNFNPKIQLLYEILAPKMCFRTKKRVHKMLMKSTPANLVKMSSSLLLDRQACP